VTVRKFEVTSGLTAGCHLFFVYRQIPVWQHVPMTMSPAELKGAVHALASMALRDPCAFNELVLRDERTGRRIRNGTVHQGWHDLVGSAERVVIWASVESGKSQQITIGRTLWELGRDPSKRCLLVSKTKQQAEKFTRPMRYYLEHSPELRLIFPHLKPGKIWTDGAFDIAGKSGAAKDFSVEAAGLDGNILGARYDWVVIDDLLDWETTRTQYQREKVLSWLRTTVFGRLTADAKVIILTNAWERDDAAHILAGEGWANMRSPLIDWETGELAWEERWSRERIEKFRAGNPSEFDRQIMCIPRKPGEQRFREEWFFRCLEKGKGRTMIYSLDCVPENHRTITGVDLGIGLKDHHDLTALCTILVNDLTGEREIIWLESGRWPAPEIIDRVVAQHERYGSTIYVENNQGQEFLVQFAQMRGNVPIRRFTTGRNKWHPSFGVESLAAEMSAGRWIIPCGQGTPEKEIRAWMDEMRYFDPGSHTGDRLMASWIAREGARRGEGTHRVDHIAHNPEAVVLDEENEDPVGAHLWQTIREILPMDENEW
jgi:hypothetical protein